MTKEMTPKQITKIRQLLDESAQAIDSKALARLAESRRQAVAALEKTSHVANTRPVLAGWGRLLELSQRNDVRLWLFVLLLMAALAVVISSSLSRNNQPIETDSLLLASELPPETFADKEFVAWLEHTSHL
jgi:hypothetical protein